MPSKSQAQRDYLFATFGADWVRKHGFNNKGPLPEHVRSPQGGRFASHGRVVKNAAQPGRRP